VRSAECGMRSEKLKQRQRWRSHAKATGGQAEGRGNCQNGRRPTAGNRGWGFGDGQTAPPPN